MYLNHWFQNLWMYLVGSILRMKHKSIQRFSKRRLVHSCICRFLKKSHVTAVNLRKVAFLNNVRRKYVRSLKEVQMNCYRITDYTMLSM